MTGILWIGGLTLSLIGLLSSTGFTLTDGGML